MSLTLYVNNSRVDYKTLIFKGGEVQVKLPPMGDQLFSNQAISTIAIMAHIRNSNHVMELLLLTDAIRREVGSHFPIDVCIPYVPYARQDRVCDKGESLSLKVFADLINSQNYRTVVVWDPHSDVAPALINNVKIVKDYKFVDKALDKINRKNVILVSPDAGANKKIMETAQYTRIENIVRADKKRNPKDGAITGTVVYSQPVGAQDFLIVDDICDGGRTFIELAKALKPLTTGKIYLYVTHGIFSAGFGGLKEHIEHVFTANSFVDLAGTEDFVTQVSL